MVGSNRDGGWNLRGKARHSRVLLVSLLVLLAAFPFLEEVTRPIFLILPVAGVFVAGVIVVRSTRLRIRGALVLAGIQILLVVMSDGLKLDLVPRQVGVSLVMASMIVLILFSMYCVLGYVLQARVIGTDQIYAGICVYLMLGFAFGAVFYLLSILQPGSFSVNVSLMGSGGNPDLMYFSFVTLATLGYGDISPISKVARSLSSLEALSGSLYMAVFMARLVSLGTSPREGRD